MEYTEEPEKKIEEKAPEVALKFYHFLEEDEGPVDGKYVIVRKRDGEEMFATLPRRRAELHTDIIDILESELGEKVTAIGGGYFEKVDPAKESDKEWAVQGKSSDFGVEENRKRTAALLQAQFPQIIVRS
jgi:hypothetical protein